MTPELPPLPKMSKHGYDDLDMQAYARTALEAQAARIATLEAALRDADDALDLEGYHDDGPTRGPIRAALAKQP